MYADDVKLYHRIQHPDDVAALQSDLDRLLDWSKTWRLQLNPSKCSFISFTLRTSPINASYTLDGHDLQRCHYIRDLGVLLDSKLTFSQHVDATMAKSNRMLGLLIRSMQSPKCPRTARFDHRPIMTAFNAHIRSVLEYASVIWCGAAQSHLVRLERLHHRFLMWLGATTQSRCPPMDYDSLLEHFKTTSLRARFTQADIMFMNSVIHHRIDCAQLTSLFALNVPGRRSRHTGLFHEPFGRVNTVLNSPFVRIPKTCNLFLQQYPWIDFFHTPASFRREALSYARGLPAFAG